MSCCSSHVAEQIGVVRQANDGGAHDPSIRQLRDTGFVWMIDGKDYDASTGELRDEAGVERAWRAVAGREDDHGPAICGGDGSFGDCVGVDMSKVSEQESRHDRHEVRQIVEPIQVDGVGSGCAFGNGIENLKDHVATVAGIGGRVFRA